MAGQIAEAFGATEESNPCPLYKGSFVNIIWTGGPMIDLIQKDSYVCDGSERFADAATIVRRYYNAVPRKVRNSITAIDKARIAFIEHVQSNADEIIFMCQPTDEGERLIQALKLFFGFKVPTRTIYCDCFTTTAIKDAVEGGLGYTSKLVEHLSAEAMQRIFFSDLARLKPVQIGVEQISYMAHNLLNEIKNYDEMCCYWDGNRAQREGALDINTLYVAMDVRYDMTMGSLWDSLIYLYGKGLISNPMTHCPAIPDKEIVFGQGSSEGTNGVSLKKTKSLLPGIAPTDKRDESLIGLDYDHENAPDEFVSRTSAIYSYIIDFAEGNLKSDDIDTAVLIEEGRVPIAAVEAWIVNGNDDFYTKSLKDCFGSLIFELQCAELIEVTKGFVLITELGYALSKDEV